MNKNIQLKKDLILRNITNNQSLFDGLSYEGLCIIRDFEVPIFVYNLLPQEIADIQITYYSKKCCFAKVINFIKTSNARRKLDLDESMLYESGSALLVVLSYENQIEFKQNLIENLFRRNLGINKINSIIKSPNQLSYRNKITLQVDYKTNKISFGFYKRHSHELVEQKDLLLANQTIRDFYKSVLLNPSSKNNKQFKDTILSLKPKKITLRANNYSTNEIEIILYIDRNIEKRLIDNLNEINKLDDAYKISIFNELENKWINLLNHQGIKCKINNNIFEVKNDSFYQINEEVTKEIYQQIYELIPNENLNVVDAFSGVGTIACYIANKTNKVYSIELNKNATDQAKRNIELNNISNIEIINADANEWINQNKEKIDLIIFDPPREGLRKESINAIVESKINKILYLSCDPKTLIRDLNEFVKNDYLIKKVQPFDMFPQTPHIETLVLIEKKYQI
ncbi:23S rRNA (uracil(1939)-C(5))-methyltransferase RlmD [Metamycoplasma auris]|uniref:23S rRNA (Uracil1939-C5)-methyltransferase n=1 Tax=Metamycoplasma auris TaxID=51363 RepID=A0A2W7G623_9BACT|nr:23S rRNA (uracil(1939)-C(5))-methyltransferase RlmD [Metamycoplasma auris]PZW00561.1 23S rRNA (uracil1939-C5)-methyltransferase [Metamycoplasma auris]